MLRQILVGLLLGIIYQFGYCDQHTYGTVNAGKIFLFFLELNTVRKKIEQFKCVNICF